MPLILLLSMAVQFNGLSGEPELDDIESTFDSGTAEGWQADLGSLVIQDSGNSNNPKYAELSAPSDGFTSYFVAPTTYRGDWLNGGNLNNSVGSGPVVYFRLRSSGTSDTYISSVGFLEDVEGDLFIWNNTNGWGAMTFSDQPLDNLWFSHRVTFNTDSENWTLGGGATSLEDILDDVQFFAIRGEYSSSGDELVALDEVSLVTGFEYKNPPYDDEGEDCSCSLAWLFDSGCGRRDFAKMVAHTIDMVAFFREFRDDTLIRTDAGRYYVELYYEHTSELTTILMSDSDLRDRTIQFLGNATDEFAALSPTAVDTATLDQALYDEAKGLMEDLADAGSPQFKSKMLEEWEYLNLEQYVGMETNEIWEDVQVAFNENPPQEQLFLPVILDSP